jgi:hypothetical protein
MQRPTLDDGQDGHVLGQPGVLQLEEAGVLDAQALVAADELAHGRLPADHPLPRPNTARSASAWTASTLATSTLTCATTGADASSCTT